jgi:hypothetical protein
MQKTNNIINKYFHHNKQYVAYCFENYINIYDFLNNKKLIFNINNMTPFTQLIFISDFEFMFMNYSKNKFFLYNIQNQTEINFIKEYEFTSIKDINILLIKKYQNISKNKSKIIIAYYNDKKFFISEINLKNAKIKTTLEKIETKSNNYSCFFTKKYIYILNQKTNQEIYEYSIKLKKLRIINLNFKNYKMYQFQKNIYIIDDTNKIFNIRQKIIDKLDSKNKLIFISKDYIISLDSKNNKLICKNRINNNKKYIENFNFYFHDIVCENTVLTKENIFLQVKSNIIIIINIKNFTMKNDIGNIYNYKPFIKVQNIYDKFNIFVSNHFIYNKKIVGKVIYQDRESSYDTQFYPITITNKVKFFQSKYNLCITNYYTENNRQLIKLSDLYNKEPNYLKNFVFDSLKNNIDKINDYSIIMPIYFYNENMKDTQFVITGKILQNENPINAVQREIFEETGFYVKKEKVKYINEYDDKNSKNKRKITLFSVCIENKEDLESHEKFSISKEKDLFDKIYVIVWGKTDFLNEIIKEINYRPPAPDNDGSQAIYIGGIRIISLSEFL